MDDLQFERADFGPSTAAPCTGCRQPMTADYYDLNGRPFCPACTTAVQQAHGTAAVVGGMLLITREGFLVLIGISPSRRRGAKRRTWRAIAPRWCSSPA